jgi:hypothetical protein
MTLKRLTPAFLGLMLSSGLMAAATTVQPTIASDPAIQVQQHADLSTAANPDILAPAAIDALLLQMLCLGLPSALILGVSIYNQRKQQQAQIVAQLVRIRVRR